jgi:hypothetical protein
MSRAPNLLWLTAVTVTVASFIGACASSSAHRTTVRAASPPPITGATPRGWTDVQAVTGGADVVLALPPGWALTTQILDLQTHNNTTEQSMVPARSPGTPAADGAARPGTLYDGAGAGIIAFTPKASFGVLGPWQARRSDLRSEGVRHYSATVTSVTLAAVSQAHVVTEHWQTAHGSWNDEILLARTKNRGELEVIAQDQPGTPKVFNPAKIISSIRLQDTV